MSLSYYDVTVPVFTKTLTNLKQFLQKGAVHALETGLSESDFLNLKLAPDMFPLSRQIQISTDNAKGAVARLTETEPLVIPDTETTVAELVARIDTVIAHLETYTPERFAQAAETTPTLPYFPGKHFVGHDYLVEYALPNFFFHVNMAYAIIRHSGVPLGKADYVGNLTLHDGAH
jgi:uncharacterized protein